MSARVVVRKRGGVAPPSVSLCPLGRPPGANLSFFIIERFTRTMRAAWLVVVLFFVTACGASSPIESTTPVSEITESSPVSAFPVTQTKGDISVTLLGMFENAIPFDVWLETINREGRRNWSEEEIEEISNIYFNGSLGTKQERNNFLIKKYGDKLPKKYVYQVIKYEIDLPYRLERDRTYFMGEVVPDWTAMVFIPGSGVYREKNYNAGMEWKGEFMVPLDEAEGRAYLVVWTPGYEPCDLSPESSPEEYAAFIPKIKTGEVCRDVFVFDIDFS